MTQGITTAIAATKTLTLVLGGLITYLSFKAYRRTGSTALRELAFGFGVVTFGSMIAGGLDLILQIDLLYGVLVQSVLTALGFAIITYSLYME